MVCVLAFSNAGFDEKNAFRRGRSKGGNACSVRKLGDFKASPLARRHAEHTYGVVKSAHNRILVVLIPLCIEATGSVVKLFPLCRSVG